MFNLAEALAGILGGELQKAASGAIPRHLKSEFAARIERANPFSTISGNHDLMRAVRIAWIRAAEVVLDAAAKASAHEEFADDRKLVAEFKRVADRRLGAVRQEAFNRGGKVGSSPIDAHAVVVLGGTPEFITPSARVGGEVPLTTSFVATLAALTEWTAKDIPPIFGRVAEEGVSDGTGERPRSFGELVFSDFAEILKSPTRYPEAGEAFHIHMAGAIHELGKRTLAELEDIKAGLKGDGALAVFGAGAYEQLAGWHEETLGLMRKGLSEIEATRQVIEKHASTIIENQKDHTRRLETIETMVAGLGDKLEEAVRAGVSRPLLREVAGRVHDDTRAGEQRQADFADAVDTAIRSTEDYRRQQVAGRPGILEAALSGVVSLTLAGKLDEASDAASRTFDAWLDAGQQPAEIGERIGRAGIDADLLRRDADRIAQRIVRWVDTAGRGEELLDHQNGWLDRGERSGVLLDLRIALAIGRQMLERASDAFTRGSAHHAVGNALLALSNHDADLGLLEEALAAFRVALAAWIEGAAPAETRAIAANSVAGAMLALAKRESGTQRLLEAIAMMRSGAAAIPRDDAGQWALFRTNLSQALSLLGERTGDPAPIKDAVAVLREAIAELPYSVAPGIWVQLHIDLGVALIAQGEREGDLSRFEQAAVVMETAVGRLSPQTNPVEWARAHNGWGNALARLGEHAGDAKALARAEPLYRAGLTSLDRHQQRQLWILLTCNLARTLDLRGQSEQSASPIKEAIAIYREVLVAQPMTDNPVGRATVMNDLGTALLNLTVLKAGGVAELREAAGMLREALRVRTREGMPFDWAGSQFNLGNVLAWLSAFERVSSIANDAIAAYRAAALEFTPERNPIRAALIDAGIANALRIRGVIDRDRSAIDEAAGLAARALSALRTAGSAGNIGYAEFIANAVEEARASV